MPSATILPIHAVPSEPPSSRVRLNRPVALPRWASGRSESAATLTGMNTNARPNDRIMLGYTRSRNAASEVRWAATHCESAVAVTPTTSM